MMFFSQIRLTKVKEEGPTIPKMLHDELEAKEYIVIIEGSTLYNDLNDKLKRSSYFSIR